MRHLWYPKLGVHLFSDVRCVAVKIGGMNELNDWLAVATNGASHRAIARALDLQSGALSRWIRTETIPAQVIIDIARHYRANPIEALCVAGFLTQDEVSHAAADVEIKSATDLNLVDELHRRIMRQTVVDEVKHEATEPPAEAPPLRIVEDDDEHQG
jgi:transposase-like protein